MDLISYFMSQSNVFFLKQMSRGDLSKHLMEYLDYFLHEIPMFGMKSFCYVQKSKLQACNNCSAVSLFLVCFKANDFKLIIIYPKTQKWI